ncbi:MAG: DUF1643 domain-containing protein [Sulfitobacter sp.]|nr:DUF1643 domain-containing protein [Sulfitobacter sp.]
MITREHSLDGTRSMAQYSPCERYRYLLKRTWAEGERQVMFVMLNPSTADERRNDPTIERCERRARQLGYGGFIVTNLFAWRATDPRDLRRAPAPQGPENDAVLQGSALQADEVIAAWGVHGAHRARGPQVAAMLRRSGRPLFHLGLSKEGHPRHPLYLPYAIKPEPWSVPLHETDH